MEAGLQRRVEALLHEADVTPGGGRPQDIDILDPRFHARVLAEGSLGLGESYMDGWWQAHSLDTFLTHLLAARLDERVHGGGEVWDALKARLFNLQAGQGSYEVGKRHYDLGNDLYRAMLGKRLVYSCGYWRHAGNLDDAQEAKLDLICRKLGLRPGMRVLDIGCGWGGLTRYLVEVAGAGHATGITLSEEQLKGARELAARAGHPQAYDYRLEDYRATPGRFDRIVSVGMFEHVGVGYHDAFFRKCHDLLTDDGVMLLHFIGNSDVPDFNNPWIEKYIFPGGHIPSLSEFTPAIERSGLVVTDIEVLRLHYASTLRIWRDRFLARRAEAVALYDERFARMWEYYLSMSETAFRYQDIAIFQVQLARRQESVPLTRDYVGEREAGLREAEARLGLMPSGT